jgi:uncharacterized membrane protein
MTPITIDEYRLTARLCGGLWGRLQGMLGNRLFGMILGGLWGRLRGRLGNRLGDIYGDTGTHDADRTE